jgi:class 3 adenylate cyclase
VSANAGAQQAKLPTALDLDERRDAAERRQLTVMFCDLVGSTALSAIMDPEDLREVIALYQKTVGDSVRQFDGFVAKYMGDGVLIYFGYPQAHEDGAERAVRVALGIVSSLGKLETSTPEPLGVRIGIATGLIVVGGDLIGSGEAQERGTIGETPNLAARLQSIADPNEIVIADSTRRLFGNLFVCRDVGMIELKGLRQPVRASRVLDDSTVESRFEALHASSLLPLVGREEEIDLLVRRWQLSKSRDGQAVLISGEPGIGKSRLAAAFLDRVSADSLTRVRYLCSPHHTDSARFIQLSSD